MSTVTRPRRTSDILPREDIGPDPFATVPDVCLAFRVRSQSVRDRWYATAFDYRAGEWSCDCLAGQRGTRCKHVNACAWWARYDAAHDWISRLSPADLAEYDVRIAKADLGVVPAWVGLDVDRAVVGDVLAARLGPISRSGISVEQCRDELFG
jgi:hypothetical protein